VSQLPAAPLSLLTAATASPSAPPRTQATSPPTNLATASALPPCETGSPSEPALSPLSTLAVVTLRGCAATKLFTVGVRLDILL
jgi:hypothetical protein